MKTPSKKATRIKTHMKRCYNEMLNFAFAIECFSVKYKSL